MSVHLRLLTLVFQLSVFQKCECSTVFKDGHDYFYTYAAESNVLNIQNITTIVKLRIRHVNFTKSGDLKQLFIDSFFQRTQEGRTSTNPLNWTFSRPFLFQRNTNGEVISVHYHDADEPELVTLKKSLASPFGFHMQESKEPVWSYSVNETDHSGLREHRYFAARHHDNAIHLKRHHRSVKDVERHHNQDVKISPDREIHTIQATDKLLMANTLPKVQERKPDPSEYQFEGKETGEFPVIETASAVKITLDDVIPHGQPVVHHHGLNRDSIVAREETPKQVPLLDIQQNITSSLNCIREISNKYASARAECVHSLRDLLEQLKPTDLRNLATSVLNETCDENDTVCQDDRFLFIDILCQFGRPDTQTLIVKHVLNVELPHPEELRRTLFHYVALNEPQKDTIQAVWNVCFGRNREKHGTHNNTKNTHRACLTLGAIARTLSEKDEIMSTKIVEELASWLGKHDGSYVEPAKVRIRRSVVPPKNETEDLHRLSKTVLIEALGNSGHPKALEHILTFVKPNVGHSAWRRSGIHAMRWHTCKQSAEALIGVAISDDHATVREQAYEMYKEHPRRQNMTDEEENAILSKKYTYPTVMFVRAKRGALADLMKWLSFKLEAPGVNWSKTIGNSAIGASFGIKIHNRMELRLKPLSGFFEIDVDNKAWITGLLQIIRREVDIFKVKACYQGSIRYDLNILKDFGINDISDMAGLLDKIILSVRKPIEDAVKAVQRVVKLFKGNGLRGIVDDMIKLVREFPVRLKDLVDRLIEFAKKVSDYDGLPWVRALKKVFFKVKYFVEDVKNDITNFYNSIVDTITVTLPFVVERIKEAIKLMVKGFSSLFKNPMQAISLIIKASLNMKMSISMILGAKQKIEESCFFLSGKLPYWMKPGDELQDLFEDVKVAVLQVNNFINRARDLKQPQSDIRVGRDDGILTMEQHEIEIARQFKDILDGVLTPMEEMRDIAEPFIDAYKSVFGAIKSIKKAYYDVRATVDKGRSLLQKIFGPKFHKHFPSFRVDCEESPCACGIFPSTVDGLFNKGVDIRVMKDSKVVCPALGVVKRRNDKEVIIEASRESDLGKYEIIVTNIKPDIKISKRGRQIEAGELIGRVANSQCDPSFIHVAMRKKPRHKKNRTKVFRGDEDYTYVDPTPFLEKLLPVPRWETECKEFSLKYIGQTAEQGETVGDERESSSPIGRLADDDFDSGLFDDDDDMSYRPPEMDSSTTDTFKTSFQSQANQFKDPVQSDDENIKAPNILDKLNINEFKLSSIIRILDKGGLERKKAMLNTYIVDYSNYMKEQPIQHPMTFSPRRLRYLLQKRSMLDSGSFEQMVSRYIECPMKESPRICAGVTKDYGLFCQPHSDSLGVTCGIVFQLNLFRTVTKLDLRLNYCANRIDVKLGKNNISLDTCGGVDTYVIHIGGLDAMEAFVQFDVTCDQKSVNISLRTQLCSAWYPTCTEMMKLFNDIVLLKPSTPCVEGPIYDGTIDQVRGMELQYFVDDVLDANIGDRQELLTFLAELRTATLEALMDNPELIKEIMGTEFADKTDVCVHGDIPFPSFDITFFKFRSIFFVGPVSLRLRLWGGGSVGVKIEVGACFLSMNAFVRVTPYTGAKVTGDISVDILIAAAGLKLTGYFLETRFPTTGTVKFDKFPLDVGMKMDLIFVPIRFKLSAFLLLRLFFFDIRTSFTLWKCEFFRIEKNIFNRPLIERDTSPPIVKGCQVTQLENRDPTDPAFMLEVSAEDEVSDLKIKYAIGSHLGGNNIQDWVDIGGASVTVPVVLENAIPLFWTVKIANSQGLEATAQCSLPTYDTTPPDGRLEASYTVSSHPHKLSATLVLIDDSPLDEKQYQAVGFGQGAFGNSLVDWELFEPDRASWNTDAIGDLRRFSTPRQGRLTANPMKKVQTSSDNLCATECIHYGTKCISFDYDQVSESCYLHATIQGESADLKRSGYFYNYERVIGHTSIFEFDNLPLSHSEVYYINAKITNSLGYVSYLSTSGTVIDFTPPEPGYISNVTSDTITHDGCKASILQRCKDLTWHPNHRTIIDGLGSRTVFNGHDRLFDLRYTLDNHFLSAHWNGFTDPESGLWGYTWSSGSTICGTDVSAYDDPHAHLSGKSFWTHHGLASNLHLADGFYYVTVQAINNVFYGGALVTTLCHSQPLVIDTTKPVINPVDDYVFDEDFDLLVVFYNASDSLSQVERVDFGLGHTKYDVKVRKYSRHDHSDGAETYISVEGIGLQDGEPAWIRLRAVNSVELFAAGHSTHPIMVDRSPPEQGKVSDGQNIHIDIAYQSDNTTLCAHWKDFFDEHSGIKSFFVGFGVEPDHTTALVITELSHLTKTYCYKADLEHNQTYYATVVALNRGLNPKRVNASSDGVLIDVTPPSVGWVNDGLDVKRDIKFTHKQAEVSAHYGDFVDIESGISSYQVTVFVNGIQMREFDNKQSETFEEHSFSIQNGDHANVMVSAVNGAGSITSNRTNGVVVDLTPPVMLFLRDSVDGRRYQTRNDGLVVNWKFEDLESGIAMYRFATYQYHGGSRIELSNHDIIPTRSMELNRFVNLTMLNGARYTVQVTSINHAQLSTTHESDGVRVDTTEPIMSQVIIGLSRDEEDLNDEGQILHLERDTIFASWLARDGESGVVSYLVAVGTSVNDVSVTDGFIDFGPSTHGHITGLSLSVSSETGELYYVIVKAINGAGLESNNLTSFPINVLRENIPGVVFDGRIRNVDENIQADSSSLAINFGGFESQACGIIEYEWAVGTAPGFTDIQQFSDYGIVLQNDTHGHAESNIRLVNGMIYYATVRAVTGHNCHEDYIVSVSDGVMVDSSPPKVFITRVGTQGDVNSDDPYYQSVVDDIRYSWQTREGESNITLETWAFSSLPTSTDLHNTTVALDSFVPGGSLSLPHGKTGFLTVEAFDSASNLGVVISPPLTVDTTPPTITEFTCTPFLSLEDTVITCHWDVIESESAIASLSIAVGREQGGSEIAKYGLPSVSKNNWQFNAHAILNRDVIPNYLYVNLNVTNSLQQIAWLPSKVVIDVTPPEGGAVRVINRHADQDIHCQTAQTYIDIAIDGFKDEETGIQRYDVCVGSMPKADDIASYRDVGLKLRSTIAGLKLTSNSVVYVTVKAYNNVGLTTAISSKAVTISPSPSLVVNDGRTDEDIDYQNSLSGIAAHWQLKGGCTLTSVKWSIFRIDGVKMKPTESVPIYDSVLVDDSVNLENEKTYFVEIEMIDVLKRVFRAKTNGVSISMESPKPGKVVEGHGGDIEYQLSNTVLHAEWSEFGEDDSKNPSQLIVCYELALGDGSLSKKSRENVHPFISVGLNNSYTFTHLNLTAKTVKYFVTVRARSASGSTVTVSSNGVFVGFREGISPGSIHVQPAQTSTTFIEVSWSEFESDLPLLKYNLAVSTAVPDYNMSCNVQDYPNVYDISPMTDVGLDTVHTVNNITLLHGQGYYVTIKAVDVAGNCKLATSSPIVVDLSPPMPGNVSVGTMSAHSLAYVKKYNSLFVEWGHFADAESSIGHYDVSLFEQKHCQGREFNIKNLIEIHPSVRVMNDSEVLLEGLALKTLTPYFVKIEATNKAGLSVVAWSLPIFVDDSIPVSGSIKYGNDWTKNVYYQTSLAEIETMVAIDHADITSQCKSQELFALVTPAGITPDIAVFDTKPKHMRWAPKAYFVERNVRVGGKNDTLKLVSKSTAFMSHLELAGFAFDVDVHEGNFSAAVTGIEGLDMVTSVTITEKDILREFGKFDLPNVKNETGLDSFKTTDLVSNSTHNASYVNASSHVSNITYNESVSTRPASSNEPAVGIHILGFEIKGTKHILFWGIGDEGDVKEEWIDVDFSPYTESVDYKITFEMDEATGTETWNSRLLIANRERAILYGVQKPSLAQMDARVWNRQNNIPPPLDHSGSYRSEATISNILIALPRDKLCMFGKAFYDPESKIDEIWMGIGTKNDGSTDFLPLAIVKQPCTVCVRECDYMCGNPCEPDDFQVYDITLKDLSLTAGTTKSRGDAGIIEADATETFFEPSIYFVVVKVVNLAGESTTVVADGITVDVTPPNCTAITCVDPAYSMIEPVMFLGSNDTMGAYWECSEDATQIVRYEVSIGTEDGLDNVYSWTNVKLNDKVRLDDFPDPLLHNRRYWFNVETFNKAGLSTKLSCNLTTDLIPPDTSVMKVTTIGTKTDPRLPPDVLVIETATETGLKWTHGPSTAVVYEWEIETEDGKEDVLPPVQVGVADTTGIQISNGQLDYDGSTQNTSLSLLTANNYTGEDLEQVKKDTFFELEPGRCTRQTLLVLNKANVKSKIPTPLTCVKRPTDEIVDLRNGEMKHVQMTFDNRVLARNKTILRTSDVHIHIRGNASVITGKLNEADLKARYGSAASTTFVPYIQEPEKVAIRTSASGRLRNRFKTYSGSSFFVAPAGDATISEPISVEMKFHPESLGDNEVPLLMFYDPDEGQWNEACESCGTCDDNEMDKDVNWIDNTVRSQICSTRSAKNRRKRSNEDSTALRPVELSLINADTTLHFEGSCSWACPNCANIDEEDDYQGNWEFDAASIMADFTCQQNSGTVIGVSVSYDVPGDVDGGRLQLFADEVSGSSRRISCIDSNATDGLTVALRNTPGGTTSNITTCTLPAGTNDGRFRFYLTNALEHVTRDDFLFKVDCRAKDCIQTVSDVDTRPIDVRGYFTRVDDKNKPIGIATTTEKLILVLQLTKSPAAQAISVSKVTFNRRRDSFYDVFMIKDSCGTRTSRGTRGWARDEGFAFLKEDDDYFYVVSPELNASTLGIHDENATMDFTLTVRRCTKIGDRTCHSNNCPDNWSDKMTSKHESTASVTIDIIQETFIATADYTAILVSIPVIICVAVFVGVGILRFRFKMRRKLVVTPVEPVQLIQMPRPVFPSRPEVRPCWHELDDVQGNYNIDTHVL